MAASIDKIKEKISRFTEQHEKTAQKLAALKEKYEEEEKKLREEMDKVNAEWAKDFAAAAAVHGIQINLIDVKLLASLVKENQASLIAEKLSEQSPVKNTLSSDAGSYGARQEHKMEETI